MFHRHAFLFIAFTTFKTKSNQYLTICGTVHSPLHLTSYFKHLMAKEKKRWHVLASKWLDWKFNRREFVKQGEKCRQETFSTPTTILIILWIFCFLSVKKDCHHPLYFLVSFLLVTHGSWLVVSGVVLWPFSWVGALYRVNLIAPFNLKKNCPRKKKVL